MSSSSSSSLSSSSPSPLAFHLMRRSKSFWNLPSDFAPAVPTILSFVVVPSPLRSLFSSCYDDDQVGLASLRQPGSTPSFRDSCFAQHRHHGTRPELKSSPHTSLVPNNSRATLLQLKRSVLVFASLNSVFASLNSGVDPTPAELWIQLLKTNLEDEKAIPAIRTSMRKTKIVHTSLDADEIACVGDDADAMELVVLCVYVHLVPVLLVGQVGHFVSASFACHLNRLSSLRKRNIFPPPTLSTRSNKGNPEVIDDARTGKVERAQPGLCLCLGLRGKGGRGAHRCTVVSTSVSLPVNSNIPSHQSAPQTPIMEHEYGVMEEQFHADSSVFSFCVGPPPNHRSSGSRNRRLQAM